MSFELGDSRPVQSMNQASVDPYLYLTAYVEHEARMLAHQIFLKLQTKLLGDEAIMEYGRRFCQNFYTELTKELLVMQEEEPSSSHRPDTTDLLSRQDSSASDDQGDGVLAKSPDGGYSCSTNDLINGCLPDSASTCQNGNCPSGGGGQRRCSTVSASGSLNLTCSVCQSKSFFRRRLSLHSLNPFHRRTGPEPKYDKCPLTGQISGTEVSNSTGPMSAITKHRCAGELRVTRVDMTVEIVREDLCTFLTVNSSLPFGQHAQSPRWEPCRLALAKTPAGHLLQVFAPPKSTKAKKSIFCASIEEAKDASESDAPCHDCVFIIQLIDGAKYMFRLDASNDRRSWVYDMQRTGVSRAKIPVGGVQMAGTVRPRLSTFPPSEIRRVGTQESALSAVGSVSGVSPGGQALSTVSRQNSLLSCSSSSRTGTITADSSSTAAPLPSLPTAFAGPMVNIPTEEDALTESLSAYPWYHKAITRGEAAALVAPTSAMESSYGRFLIRASETRPGEFVVTFNAYGKPKHLRICVEPSGHCRVQSLWFSSVQAMTEHYRQHPLPLESGYVSDVKLTECVSPIKSARGRSGSIGSTTGDHVFRPANMLHFTSSDPRFKTAKPCIDEESKGVM